MLPNLRESADLVTFTEEILNGKLHFFISLVCSVVHFRPNVPLSLHKTPEFHLLFWCGNFMETHSFCRVLGDLHRCFPVNFPNFEEHLFYRTSLGDCFCRKDNSTSCRPVNPFHVTLYLLKI